MAASSFSDTKKASYYGMEFFGLSNSKTAVNKLSDQTLWYFGLPASDIFPLVLVPRIGAGSERKRSAAGSPTSVKVISAAMPSKRSFE